MLETGNIPTPEEWQNLWSVWDLITLGMIPQGMLHQKPIDLRHKCLFYIGHIPTFLDMLLSKAIGGSPTEPRYFWNIFERGIDPHVDDPEHCHSHSEVPDKDEDWPTIDTIVKFRNGVRQRLMNLYEDMRNGQQILTRNIARTLVMTIEHEGWHIETLLYMLIQRAGTGTLPPPGFAVPMWDALSEQWDAAPSPSTSCVVVGPATVTLGHDDCEGEDYLPENEANIDKRIFGWDNESPARTVDVHAFRAEWRPVTNGEYLAFLRGRGKVLCSTPKSWVEEDGDVKHWPVLTSYDDLAAYATFKGGRLPTEPELRLFLDTYEVGHEGGANTGFRNWHPIPNNWLEVHGGKGSNGGVWEWTSTLFDGHNGLSPTKLFTG
nr:C-type lectin protein [Cyathus striatus]